MVNFKVHCVRFIPYVPQAIHCLAVEGGKNARIAVSRYNDEITKCHNINFSCTCYMSEFYRVFSLSERIVALKYGILKITGI